MIPPYLYAEISLVTTIGDVDSDNIYQVVCPYLNSSNKITFTVNFDGGDENTYDGGRIKTKISWHENGYTPGDPTAVIAGNINIGNKFLKIISPFIWRKYLDYSVISELFSLLAQLQTYKKEYKIIKT